MTHLAKAVLYPLLLVFHLPSDSFLSVCCVLELPAPQQTLHTPSCVLPLWQTWRRLGIRGPAQKYTLGPAEWRIALNILYQYPVAQKRSIGSPFLDLHTPIHLFLSLQEYFGTHHTIHTNTTYYTSLSLFVSHICHKILLSAGQAQQTAAAGYRHGADKTNRSLLSYNTNNTNRLALSLHHPYTHSRARAQSAGGVGHSTSPSWWCGIMVLYNVNAVRVIYHIDTSEHNSVP